MELLISTIAKFTDNEIDVDETCELLEFWADSHQGNDNILEQANILLSELYENHKIGESVHKKFFNAINKKTADEEDDDDETVIVEPLEIDDDDEVTVFTGNNDDAVKTTSQQDDGNPDVLQAGSILKERFNLISVLGEGGMGIVYKAIDMLKVEAKDMNPYVAIKVLSEDFKEHPDAFISLQRETSKAQKLAHPNISTVYDFDRDKDTVYMTMELLEGKPLDEFIKSMPKDGLPEEEALEIINGLGSGLAYAHDNGLVHSDFKPGNAFVLYDGPVKVIDFGIARAATSKSGKPRSNQNIDITDIPSSSTNDISDVSVTNTSDDTTGQTYATEDYDAGTLGALTPAYATVEMFEGMDPAPSDDIYALACVAVQLLTGKHPYKKKPAPKAMKLKMEPPVIEGLTKRQQRALEKGLQFTRDKRTETMEEFLDGIRRRKNYTKQIVLGTLLGLSLIGGLGYKPVTNYYEQKEIDEIIARTNQGSQTYVMQTLESLTNYTPQKRTAIKTGIREKALAIYAKKIEDSVNLEQEKYGFSKADEYIEQALLYYSDSAAIKDISDKLEEDRKTIIASLIDDYIKHLLAKRLLADDENKDITDALDLLGDISPNDPTFKDSRLELGYYLEAKKATSQNDFDKAQNLIETGKKYIKNNTLFKNQSDLINISKLKHNIFTRQKEIEAAAPVNAANIEYENHINDLAILSIKSQHNSRFYAGFLKYFDEAFTKNQEININVATKILETFTPALPIKKIISYNEKLTENIEASDNVINIPEIHFIKDGITYESFSDQITVIKQAVFKYKNDALAQYNLNFEKAIKPLVASRRPALISYYKDLYSDLLIPESIDTINDLLASSTNSYESNLNTITIRSTTENDKRIFRNLASENRLNDSLITYEKIMKNNNDPEFIEYAQKELSRMYVTLAESNATEGDFTTALDYVMKAKEFGSTERMDKQEYNYRKEILLEEVVALIIEIDEETQKRVLSEENRQRALKLLRSLKNNYVDDYPFIVNKISNKVNNEVIALASTELIKAHKIKEYALTIVNTRTIRNVPIKALPKPSQLALRGKIEVSQLNLHAAKATLKAAREEQPFHYQVKELEELIDEKTENAELQYKRYQIHFDNENYKKANVALDDAIKLWKDNPVYISERDFFTRALKQFDAGAKLCRSDMQGVGKQSRGVCKDVIFSLKKQAPTMVVVPAISRDSKPYAIGKYELSMKQLNDFCMISNDCSTMKTANGELPAVNVPTDVIEKYTQWLSKETGFEYQIANHEQWKNAASAGGREGNSNYNCRLRLGTKLIKGQNIVPVTSGSANNWGLINYVGNVDEVVSTEKGYVLAGGNFTDSISDCKINLQKQASANTYTGYRLVRSLF